MNLQPLFEKLNFTEEAYTVLLEFTVCCLLEKPSCIATFGYDFFHRKEEEMIARELKRFSANQSNNACYQNKGQESRICVYSPVDSDIIPPSDSTRLKMAKGFVSAIPIFKYLTDAELDAVVKSLVVMEFEDGAKLFGEGDDVCGMFLVESGNIRMIKNKSAATNKENVGRENILSKGDFTDVLAVVCYKPSSATAYAKGKLKVLFLYVNSFEDIVGPCSYYLNRGYVEKEANTKITSNPHLFMLRYDLRNFIICYVIEKPKNLIVFGLSYFSELKKKPGAIAIRWKYQEDKIEGRPLEHCSKKRICGDNYDPKNEEQDDVFPLYLKTEEQKKLIKASLKEVLIFRSLEDPQLDIVLNAMAELNISAGTVIINQGEEGDFFYTIGSGVYEAYVYENGREKVIKTYNNKGGFGELAIMYSTPRNANVRSVTNGTLWTLSRKVFTKIVLKSAFLKRKLYEDLIEEVPILKTLKPHERTDLADSLVSRDFHNEVIIREGEVGDGMYFIINGTVEIRKMDRGQEVAITQIGKDGYFGELALVTSEPRAATAYALGRVKTAFLNIETFERLLGPSKEVMRRNINVYQTKLKNVLQQMDDEQAIK